jgi:AraC-like DNA-binding protein
MPAQHLEQILRDKLITWIKAGATERIIVARPRMSAATVPSGVQITQRKMHSKRVVVKNHRYYGNVRYVSARYPEDDMDEAAIPRFICVIDGLVHFRAGNYMLACRQGDFILIPPGMPFYGGRPSDVLGIPDTSSLSLWMLPHRRGFYCWLKGYGNFQCANEPAQRYLFTNSRLVQLFELLMEELQGKKGNLLCDGLLLAFSSTLLREVDDEHYLHPGPMVSAKAPPTAEGEFIRQLRAYVEKHLHERLTLDVVARRLHMSRTQLVRRMRQETGQTFIEFLTDERFLEAQKLLKESEWTVQAIREFVGFKSSGYFHDLFQRRMGCTPLEFRLKSRQS